LTLLILTSPTKAFDARLSVLRVGWESKEVGMEPVRLLDAALILARVGIEVNLSGMAVIALPEISLSISHLLTRH